MLHEKENNIFSVIFSLRIILYFKLVSRNNFEKFVIEVAKMNILYIIMYMYILLLYIIMYYLILIYTYYKN